MNKDLSQPLRVKGVRISETGHGQSNSIYLKSPVLVNVPLILKVDQKERYVCMFEQR